MIISQSEKKDILLQYNPEKGKVAITSLLSLNENYVIFLDEMYDIKNKKFLGNVWESFDNLKIFFNDVPRGLNENLIQIKKDINSIVLLESKTQLQFLKSQFILLNEQGVLDSITTGAKNFGNWAVEKGKEAVQGTKEVVSKSVQGVKDLASKFSQGEWMQAVDIVKKGTLYLARKLRDALYHPVGMVLDAILVASGIGKSAQFVIWAIVVALDIYELTSGQYPEGQNFYTKLLFTGVDIIGLVFAGVAAKTAKGVVGNFVRTFGKNLQTMKAGIQKSPAMKGIITQMSSSLGKAPKLLEQASQWLATKSPTIHKWVSGLLTKVSGFIQKIVETLAYLGQGTIKAGMTLVNAPGKAIAKTAQTLGTSAKTAGKISQGAVGVGLATGLSYGLAGTSNTKQDYSSVSFDDTGIDFNQSL